jgi:serine/threonine protein kinase/Flp pilus assembly protein TadD
MAALNRGQWQQVQAVFQQVLDLTAAERGAFLDRACAGDPDLRREVEALLDADREADGFMVRPGVEYAAALARNTGEPDPAADAMAGRRLGAWRLLEEIGRGGMGTVYLAERADGQYEHRVALKLLQLGLAGGESRRRFLQERQILARFRHPNIATLLDGGVTDDGVPYFVMEHIEGRPVTHHCDAEGLSIDDRLAIFLQICSGIEYAHRNLVVHRDLKPSNILVTAKGEVKLLDFGVAKLLDEGADAALTGTGARLLTPQYAAPEQIRGDPVTTATDVHALGVVLYELLTGSHPFEDTEALGSTERAILEMDPNRPSAAVSRKTGGPARQRTSATAIREEIGTACGISTSQLRRRLKGDLDNIVLKALQKLPEARYATVDALAHDIRRHLNGLPVSARAPSAGYRMRKFVRRHWLAVAASSLIMLSLAGGLLATTWQARKTALQARKAETVKEFLVDLFAMADPWESTGQPMSPREMLDRGAAGIDSQLAGQPQIQAEILGIVGRLYHQQGELERARPLLERAVAMQRELFDRRDPQLAKTLGWLAAVLRAQGESEQAEPLFRESLEILRAVHGEEHPDVATALNDLAVQRKEQGDLEAAEQLHRQALALRRKVLGSDHLSVSSSLNNLAVILMQRGELEEAGELFEETLAIRRRAYGDRHVAVANTLHNLMILKRRLQDYEAAEPLAREALAIRRDLLPEDHPDITYSLFNLAAILRARGDLAQAEPMFREAIARATGTYGEDHYVVAGMQNVLGALLREKGELAKAEAASRRALAILRERLPANHPQIAVALLELGRTVGARGRGSEAETLLREANAIRLEKFGDANINTAETQLALGECLAGLGRTDEAAAELGRSHATYLESFGPDHEQTRCSAAALANLGPRPDPSLATRKNPGP